MKNIISIENEIRENSVAIASLLENANEIDPVASVQIYKGVIQYLSERTDFIKKDGIFTVEELEKLGQI